MKQLLLFPHERPLVERLGADFFRRIPESPGVYLMRSPADEVLYVGKAKNLRKRLNTYRVANPERMSRRHLRLVNSVTRIELHQCDSEASALAKESALLRNLRPRFNRAGTWPGSAHYLIWRLQHSAADPTAACATAVNGLEDAAGLHHLELGITRTVDPGWSFLGPVGSWAISLRNTLLRLLWSALFPERGLADMPQGWFYGRCGALASIPISPKTSSREIPELLSNFSDGHAEPLVTWIQARASTNTHPFELSIRTADLEFLTEISAFRTQL